MIVDNHAQCLPFMRMQGCAANSIGESGIPWRASYSGVAFKRCSMHPLGRVIKVLAGKLPMRIRSSKPSSSRSTTWLPLALRRQSVALIETIFSATYAIEQRDA